MLTLIQELMVGLVVAKADGRHQERRQDMDRPVNVTVVVHRRRQKSMDNWAYHSRGVCPSILRRPTELARSRYLLTGENKVIATVVIRPLDDAHIVFDLRSLIWGFGESDMVVHSITSEPENALSNVVYDIFFDLQPLGCDLKGNLFDS